LLECTDGEGDDQIGDRSEDGPCEDASCEPER
jgi:hypothetical protein